MPFKSGSKTVTSAGAAEALASSTIVSSFAIRAMENGTDHVGAII